MSLLQTEHPVGFVSSLSVEVCLYSSAVSPWLSSEHCLTLEVGKSESTWALVLYCEPRISVLSLFASGIFVVF